MLRRTILCDFTLFFIRYPVVEQATLTFQPFNSLDIQTFYSSRFPSFLTAIKALPFPHSNTALETVGGKVSVIIFILLIIHLKSYFPATVSVFIFEIILIKYTLAVAQRTSSYSTFFRQNKTFTFFFFSWWNSIACFTNEIKNSFRWFFGFFPRVSSSSGRHKCTFFFHNVFVFDSKDTWVMSDRSAMG